MTDRLSLFIQCGDEVVLTGPHLQVPQSLPQVDSASEITLTFAGCVHTMTPVKVHVVSWGSMGVVRLRQKTGLMQGTWHPLRPCLEGLFQTQNWEVLGALLECPVEGSEASTAGAVLLELQNQGFELECINEQHYSTSGLLHSPTGHPCFFKIMTRDSALDELCGYLALQGSYPTSILLQVRVTPTEVVCIFGKDPTVSQDQGLLCDVLNSTGQVSFDPVQGLLQWYEQPFLLAEPGTAAHNDRFFQGRIAQRLIPWYTSTNWQGLGDHRLVVNGHDLGTLNGCVEDLIDRLCEPRTKWLALTQGDPTDLNLSMAPRFFDFALAGRNDILQEAAVFIWCVAAGSVFFTPNYHPQSYWHHEQALLTPDHTPLDFSWQTDAASQTLDIHLRYAVPGRRKRTLEIYHQLLQKTCPQALDSSLLAAMVAMRCVSVFNLCTMEEHDKMLSLGFLGWLLTPGNLNTWLEGFHFTPNQPPFTHPGEMIAHERSVD